MQSASMQSADNVRRSEKGHAVKSRSTRTDSTHANSGMSEYEVILKDSQSLMAGTEARAEYTDSSSPTRSTFSEMSLDKDEDSGSNNGRACQSRRPSEMNQREGLERGIPFKRAGTSSQTALPAPLARKASFTFGRTDEKRSKGRFANNEDFVEIPHNDERELPRRLATRLDQHPRENAAEERAEMFENAAQAGAEHSLIQGSSWHDIRRNTQEHNKIHSGKANKFGTNGRFESTLALQARKYSLDVKLKRGESEESFEEMSEDQLEWWETVRVRHNIPKYRWDQAGHKWIFVWFSHKTGRLVYRPSAEQTCPTPPENEDWEDRKEEWATRVWGQEERGCGMQ